VPLPTHQRPCGDLFGGEQDHPEYDPAHPAGYETASTGLMMVGAREYDPEIGRFLQPDPQPTGPELQWGQLNRWAYCANDPINASDPSGHLLHGLAFTVGLAIGLAIGGAVGWEMGATGSPGSLFMLALQLFGALFGVALADAIVLGCRNKEGWPLGGTLSAIAAWFSTIFRGAALSALGSFLASFAVGLMIGFVGGFVGSVITGSVYRGLAHRWSKPWNADGESRGEEDERLALMRVAAPHVPVA